MKLLLSVLTLFITFAINCSLGYSGLYGTGFPSGNGNNSFTFGTLPTSGREGDFQPLVNLTKLGFTKSVGPSAAFALYNTYFTVVTDISTNNNVLIGIDTGLSYTTYLFLTLNMIYMQSDQRMEFMVYTFLLPTYHSTLLQPNLGASIDYDTSLIYAISQTGNESYNIKIMTYNIITGLASFTPLNIQFTEFLFMIYNPRIQLNIGVFSIETGAYHLLNLTEPSINSNYNDNIKISINEKKHQTNHYQDIPFQPNVFTQPTTDGVFFYYVPMPNDQISINGINTINIGSVSTQISYVLNSIAYVEYRDLEQYQSDRDNGRLNSKLYYKESIEFQQPSGEHDLHGITITTNIQTMRIEIRSDRDYKDILENVSEIIPSSVEVLDLYLFNPCLEPIPVGMIPNSIKRLSIFVNNRLDEDLDYLEALKSTVLQKGSIPSSVSNLYACYQALYQKSGEDSLIPSSVTNLKVVKCNFRNEIFGLLIPSSVETLNLHMDHTSDSIESDFIPKTVRKLVIDGYTSGGLKKSLKSGVFPNGLKELEIGRVFTDIIITLPPSLEILKLHQRFNANTFHPRSKLKTLYLFGRQVLSDVRLPETVTHLASITTIFPLSYKYPPFLTRLECPFQIITPGSIPHTIKELILTSGTVNIEYNSIPNSITKLEINDINKSVETILKPLQSLVYLKFNMPLLNPSSIKIPDSVKHLEMIELDKDQSMDRFFFPSHLETLVLSVSRISIIKSVS
eukprot:gene2279-2806_t